MKSLEDTTKMVEQLFSTPTASNAELKHRLSTFDTDSVRQALLERLEGQEVSGSNEDSIYSEVLGELGLNDEALERLAHVFSDPSREPLTRSVAAMVLTSEAPQAAAMMMASLPEEEMLRITAAGFREVIETAQYSPDNVRTLMERVASMPPDEQPLMLTEIESCRQEVGAPAAVMYSHALRMPQLARFHSAFLEPIVEEGGVEGTKLLEELRDNAPGTNARKRFQRALLRLRTHSIHAKPGASSKADARTLLGSCDGQGAFIMLACVQTKKNRFTVADLCIRASADIRDGFVIPKLSMTEMRDFVQEVSTRTSSILVPVSLEVAAGIAAAAEERTRALGIVVPEEAVPALSIFLRANASDHRPHDDLDPARDATIDDYREMLRNQSHQHWFFDHGDLSSAGVLSPASGGRTPQEWFTEAARRLEQTAVPERLMAMAEHMATWHTLRDEPKQARLCLAAAHTLRDSFSESPLIHAMLEQSTHLPRQPLIDPSELRDSNLRYRMRQQFFHDVALPKGRDLARLDLTEVAFEVLDKAANVLPGERRPRIEDQYRIAFAVGDMLPTHDLTSPSWQTIEAPTDSIKDVTTLSEEESKSVAIPLIAGISSFVDEVCSKCPVRCLDRPDDVMKDAFFSDSIPGFAADGPRQPKTSRTSVTSPNQKPRRGRKKSGKSRKKRRHR